MPQHLSHHMSTCKTTVCVKLYVAPSHHNNEESYVASMLATPGAFQLKSDHVLAHMSLIWLKDSYKFVIAIHIFSFVFLWLVSFLSFRSHKYFKLIKIDLVQLLSCIVANTNFVTS